MRGNSSKEYCTQQKPVRAKKYRSHGTGMVRLYAYDAEEFVNDSAEARISYTSSGEAASA
jgi:hypothetical protein